MSRLRVWLFRISCSYVLVLAAVIAVWFFIPSFSEDRASGAACYWTDALVPGVECVSIPLQYFLNLPGLLVYLPMFGLMALFDSVAAIPYGVLLLGVSAVLWAPLIYLAWRLFERGRVPSAT
jgi:hypothetical protein